jgi:hypothetical protein
MGSAYHKSTFIGTDKPNSKHRGEKALRTQKASLGQYAGFVNAPWPGLAAIRRTSKYYDYLTTNSEAMVMLTMIRLMLTRLAKPKQKKGTPRLKTKAA